MARLFWWLPLVSLFVASLVVPRQAAAQTKPAKPPAQKAKVQPQQATTPAQPGAKQTQPANPPAQPAGVQTQPPSTQTQPPAAQTQPAAPQTQPANAQKPEISKARVFQTAGTSDGEGYTFYLEITGKRLPTANQSIFIAPQKDLNGDPDIVSATAATVVAKFTATTKSYFPTSVAITGPGGVSNTKDLDSKDNINSTLPRIDDVEVLQLDRTGAVGTIKIDGANFGTDRTKVTVNIVPRNPALHAFGRVDRKPGRYGYYECPDQTPELQKTLPDVRSTTDDIIVVDFSFPCANGYSAPFVIARVLVTVAGDKGKPASTASYEMLPARDKNLTYRSTILSFDQARSRFGGGIANNFYVVQLSIVNTGSVKIQVPLASIQAEAQWAVGSLRAGYFIEGPPTVAPVPLTGAVSYFSTYRAKRGRAWYFNLLQGLTTIGSAIQLFFGPGFAQGVGIAGGGFRQGMGQIFPDLSEQELANLTSQSFESIETVSGNGGSIEKVIFIQRGIETIQSPSKGIVFGRQITNIPGFEITGYKVPETVKETATPQP